MSSPTEGVRRQASATFATSVDHVPTLPASAAQANFLAAMAGGRQLADDCWTRNLAADGAGKPPPSVGTFEYFRQRRRFRFCRHDISDRKCYVTCQPDDVISSSLRYHFYCYTSCNKEVSSRIGPFRFQAGGRRRRQTLALVFGGSFCVVVYIVTDKCLLLLRLI